MSGSLYVVLFDNGTSKVGKSSNVGSRVDQHTKAAMSMGVGVDKVYYTEPLPGVDIAEFALIGAFAETHEVFAGKEFFANCSIGSIEDAIKKTGLHFNSCAGLTSTTTMGETWVVARAFKLSDRDPDAPAAGFGVSVSDRIESMLKANRSIMTEGVIMNRLRGVGRGDIHLTLRKMAANGSITRHEYKHPTNRKPIVKWRLNKQ